MILWLYGVFWLVFYYVGVFLETNEALTMAFLIISQIWFAASCVSSDIKAKYGSRS